VEGAGHAVVIERPDEVNALLGAFLGRHRGITDVRES
jgi:hypothetical protein